VTPDLDDPWLARRYYGGGLPAEAERYLHLAARHYCDDAVAEAHLAAAERIAPGHRAVDLGHYKYFLYKARLTEAFDYAIRMLGHASAGIGLNHTDWRSVTPRHADFDAIEVAPRYFLFVLKAMGYLHLRLGRYAEGRELLEKVRELDPADRIGAGPLLGILDRRGEDDQE
jgi:tetratricopeptide (TPR) repeat protein